MFRERVVTIFYDDMCHLRRYLELRREEDSMFAWLLDHVVLLVDKMHIKGHKTRDDLDNLLTYCGKHCDPRSKKHTQVSECHMDSRVWQHEARHQNCFCSCIGGCWSKFARV